MTRYARGNGTFAEALPSTEWTRNGLRRAVQRILGARGVLPGLVRIWKREGLIQIGMEKGGQKLVLGGGATYREAFENVFLKPIQAREEAEQAAKEQAAAQTKSPRDGTAASNVKKLSSDEEAQT